MIRYDTPDEKGVTRRERNENFGYDSPSPDVSAAGQYLWDWYFEISDRLRRVIENQAVPISHADIHGWISINGIQIRRTEIEILYKMDDSYCEEVNLELKAYAEREKDRAEQRTGKGRK